MKGMGQCPLSLRYKQGWSLVSQSIAQYFSMPIPFPLLLTWNILKNARHFLSNAAYALMVAVHAQIFTCYCDEGKVPRVNRYENLHHGVWEGSSCTWIPSWTGIDFG